MTLVVRFAAHTDIGLHRAGNEDAYLAADPLFAVADGMGGAKAGEVASGIAIETLAERVAAGDGLAAAVRAANTRVYEQAADDPDHSGMGTTMTALRVAGDEAEIAQVGDSRAYLLRGGALERLTRDHSLVNEWLEAGSITPGEAAASRYRSVLTRALGTEAEVEVDERKVPLEAGDTLLLSSDGLHGLVPEKTILATLVADGDPERCARELVREAKSRGGTDNITAVVVRLDEAGADEAGGSGTPADGAEAASPAASAAGAAEAGAAPAGASSDVGPVAVGANQVGGAGEEPPAPRRHRLLTVLIIIALVAVVVASLVTGVIVVGNLYFVGVSEGQVAVFRGLPYEIAGVRLYRVYRQSTVPIDTVRLDLRERIEARDLTGEQAALDLYGEAGGLP